MKNEETRNTTRPRLGSLLGSLMESCETCLVDTRSMKSRQVGGHSREYLPWPFEVLN